MNAVQLQTMQMQHQMQALQRVRTGKQAVYNGQQVAYAPRPAAAGGAAADAGRGYVQQGHQVVGAGYQQYQQGGGQHHPDPRAAAAAAAHRNKSRGVPPAQITSAILEASRRRTLIEKLPPRSYSNNALINSELSRERRGGLSMLMNPDPEMFPDGHPYKDRRRSMEDVVMGLSGRGQAPLPSASRVRRSSGTKSLVMTPMDPSPNTSPPQSVSTSSNTQARETLPQQPPHSAVEPVHPTHPEQQQQPSVEEQQLKRRSLPPPSRHSKSATSFMSSSFKNLMSLSSTGIGGSSTILGVPKSAVAEPVKVDVIAESVIAGSTVSKSGAGGVASPLPEEDPKGKGKEKVAVYPARMKLQRMHTDNGGVIAAAKGAYASPSSSVSPSKANAKDTAKVNASLPPTAAGVRQPNGPNGKALPPPQVSPVHPNAPYKRKGPPPDLEMDSDDDDDDEEEEVEVGGGEGGVSVGGEKGRGRGGTEDKKNRLEMSGSVAQMKLAALIQRTTSVANLKAAAAKDGETSTTTANVKPPHTSAGEYKKGHAPHHSQPTVRFEEAQPGPSNLTSSRRHSSQQYGARLPYTAPVFARANGHSQSTSQLPTMVQLDDSPSQPLPIQLPYPYNLSQHAEPTSPRTTRQLMLRTEMSESVRQNLLWQRQQHRQDVTGAKRRNASHDPNHPERKPLEGLPPPLVKVELKETRKEGEGRRQREEQMSDFFTVKERRRMVLSRNKSWTPVGRYHQAGW
jgi:hypothetical protein